MTKKTYVTSMPDKAGAFLLASRIIARNGGNIVRVSYNKAVDLHTLFIDVEAENKNLEIISGELQSIGYLKRKTPETRVIVVSIKIPDRPGAILPVLKILDRYEINISYMNSSSNNTGYQDFKMGLLIENPQMIKMLLTDIGEVYQIGIVDYDDSEKNLDNTIFYIRLADEMQKMLNLSAEQTVEFVSESNRVLQHLQETGEDPDEVFGHIRRFADFISRHRGARFRAGIERVRLGELVTLTSIQPPCGSNTYVLESRNGELVFIDTGYAVYADEMSAVFEKLFPGWEKRNKTVYITHADVDHCGLLSRLGNAKIRMNAKSAESLRRQSEGIPDFRESAKAGYGYSRLSRIISGYQPPEAEKLEIIDTGTPDAHGSLFYIGNFSIADLDFEIYEGSGGHLPGEMVFVCRKCGVIFTGDIFVNASGITSEQAEFNSLAPYLMGSVNADSEKATEMRKLITSFARMLGELNGESCILCGGHGPLAVFSGGFSGHVPEIRKISL